MAEALQEYREGNTRIDDVYELLYGWNAYALHGNTYRLREQLIHYIQKCLEDAKPQK